MLLTKEVEVKINSRNIEHYKNLGYKIPMRKATKRTKEVMHKDYVYDLGATITVKTEDLSNGSHAKVDVLCDYCKKEIISKIYKNYINGSKNNVKDSCKKCSMKKSEETHFMMHGVRKPLQMSESREKFKETCMDRYSVEYYSKTDECKKRIRSTNLKKYGVEFSSQSLEVRKKVANAFYRNGSINTSAQQLFLHSLYGGELNFPIKYYNVDICFPDERLCMEYDGGFHDGQVKLGNITQEEFNQKEIIRNNVIKREGYKQMRIISQKDFLPSDEVLLQMLEHTRKYFSDYPEHSWMEWNIDSSSLRNAENKEGIFFDYGELRKIKKSA